MKSASLRACTIVGALGLATSALSAQCFHANQGTYVGAADDQMFAPMAIGFAFPFNGNTYTEVNISSNGFLTLSTGGVPSSGSSQVNGNWSPGGSDLTGSPTGPVICTWANDLYQSQPNEGIWLDTSTPGMAVITWVTEDFYSSPTFTAQCTLLASGEINFYYDGNVDNYNGDNHLIGCSPGNGVSDPGNSVLLTNPVSNVPTLYEMFSPYGGDTFTLQQQNVHFTPNVLGGYSVNVSACAASNQLYGAGCINQTSTFYEFVGPASFDMSGQTLTMLFTGSGYVGTLAPVTNYYALTGTSQNLSLFDDDLSPALSLPAPFPYPTGSTTSIVVHSNGQVFLDGVSVADYVPTVANFLARGGSLGVWNDFTPTYGGPDNVYFDIDPSQPIAYVTWNGVHGYGASTPWYVQFALYLQGSSAPGQVELRFQSFNNDSILSQVCIPGFSEGNGSSDPGAIDIDTSVPFVTNHVSPLALAAAPLPNLGNTVTWTTSNVPGGAILSANLLCFTGYNPGIDLTGLGAPGCLASVDPNSSAVFLLFGGPTVANSLTMPLAPVWQGTVLFSQSASLVPGANALGVITSNGVKSTLF